jgi:hypothetical protein
MRGREYLLSDEWVLGEFLNSIFIVCFIPRTLPKLLLSLLINGVWPNQLVTTEAFQFQSLADADFVPR